MFGSLPKPLDIPATTWPQVGMFIPCPAIGTVKVTDYKSYSFSLGLTSDGEIYVVSTNGYEDQTASITIDIPNASGEFTYVINPLTTKPIRPDNDGMILS